MLPTLVSSLFGWYTQPPILGVGIQTTAAELLQRQEYSTYYSWRHSTDWAMIFEGGERLEIVGNAAMSLPLFLRVLLFLSGCETCDQGDFTCLTKCSVSACFWRYYSGKCRCDQRQIICGCCCWALPLFPCCFAVSVTKRKSGWGICGSSCCVVVFVWFYLICRFGTGQLCLCTLSLTAYVSFRTVP